MAAVRADFACLALNFTLCSVLSGRFYTWSDAGRKPRDLRDPFGFVLPDAKQPCSLEQWSIAASGLQPSLGSCYWSSSLCPSDLSLLESVPPRGQVAVNGTALVRTGPRSSCAVPLVRKGSKLFILQRPSTERRSSCTCKESSGPPCARPFTLEVCHRLREYAPGEGPNPLGEEASFSLTVQGGKARGAPKRKGREGTRGKESGKATAKIERETAGVRGRMGGVQSGQGEDGLSRHGSLRAESAAEKRGRGIGGAEVNPVGPSSGGGKGGRGTGAAGADARVSGGGASQGKQGKGEEEEEEEEEEVDESEEEENAAALESLKRLGGTDSKVILNFAIAKINAKEYAAAIQLYSMIRDQSLLREKLVGRGTAYLLSGQKEKALEDFTEAVSLFPNSADVLRRRASAYESLDMKSQAFDDLCRAIKLEPENEEARHLRGSIAFNTHDYWTAIQDFNHSVQRRPNDPVVLNALGLALMGSGRYRDAASHYTAAVKKAPGAPTLWSDKGRAHKELGEVGPAEEALRMALRLEKGTVVYHRLASLKHLTGYHKEAIQLAEEGLEDNPGDIELNFLSAASKHARGNYVEAIKHYDRVLSLNAGQNSGMLTQQFLTFYLREICAYTLTKSHLPLDDFLLDDDMIPEFKAHWVKKMNPLEILSIYRTVKLSDEHVRAGPVRETLLTPQAMRLIEAADRIGGRAQYFVQGFMPNRRQYRMGGLAALDVMQRARATWQAIGDSLAQASGGGPVTEESVRQAVRELKDAPDDGEKTKERSKRTKDSLVAEVEASVSSKGAKLIKSWRGLFNNLVRWRQLSEPVDTIAWIDGLGKEFIAGFGSITAMTIGQMENLKYYPEYKRGFELMKQRVLDSEEALNGTGSPISVPRQTYGGAIMAAKTRKALWKVVGENFFVVTQCHSYSKPGVIMNGTQLTLVQSIKSHDFAIRTPVTPERMKGFGLEMQVAWEDLIVAFLDRRLEAENPHLYRQRIQDCILRIGYYWFQLMPLARGSAMVGLVSLHGLSMAANMEVTAYIPTGTQIDWESILAPTFEMFNKSVAPWFYANVTAAPLHLPNVMKTLPTVRHVIAAMSYQ